ncbi:MULTISPECIES: TetR/AcrR family transcriptional regulator [Nocardioides]|uniref:TetR/AcrR family transcriptional regulator n=1 Tax=Nocardioides vastitatis TaxID=2568655 RepID=A0ABW0ZK23_9ACTN|nr:TetR/AcrR family transcriptional regulator [Nocardioides sp.]THJ08396.1 TetR/AcrR family transcriptional regulator [Nocardioides sp.]
MTSQRHKDEGSRGRDPRDAYLDAARACILDVGWRRTTLTEVARRAGVSRMTIYRAWSDMPTLLGDLMTREWGHLVPTEHGGVPTAARIADEVLATIAALRDNELFVRIIEVDPELILPYLLARRGRSQELIIGVLASAIRAGQSAGEVRAGDPVVMARAVVLAAHGFALSVHTMVDERVQAPALDDELHQLVTRMLAPQAAR